MDLKLMTHNVNGLGDFKARKRYFNYMLKQNKDIILLKRKGRIIMEKSS